MKLKKEGKSDQRETSLPRMRRDDFNDDQVKALRQAIEKERQEAKAEIERYKRQTKARKLRLRRMKDELLRKQLQVREQRLHERRRQCEEEHSQLQAKHQELQERQKHLKKGQQQMDQRQGQKNQQQSSERRKQAQEGERTPSSSRSENRSSRDGSSSPEIIFEKRRPKKGQAEELEKSVQLPREPARKLNRVNQNSRFPGKTFVPVTEESLGKVLKIIEKFEREKRCVAIVFSSCFYLDNLDLKVIVDKFSPIFGSIGAEQVLIRVDMPKLTKKPEEAYELGFKNLNQAYIVGDLNVTENDLNRKAAARQMFCCPMTLGCLVNNLNQGLYLMHRSVVLDPRLRSAEVQSEELSGLDRSSPTEEQQPLSERRRKRDRIAAALAHTEIGSTRDCPPQPPPIPSLTSRGSALARGKLDNQLWTRIVKMGNVVVKIENLPTKLTVHSLNLMMGTFSLKGQQIIAAKRTLDSGLDVVDVMIVMSSDSVDLIRILEKNGLKTALGIKLHIQRSHHGKLRQFMTNHSENLIQLETTDKLPIKWIGYGEKG